MNLKQKSTAKTDGLDRSKSQSDDFDCAKQYSDWRIGSEDRLPGLRSSLREIREESTKTGPTPRILIIMDYAFRKDWNQQEWVRVNLGIEKE